MSKVDHGRWPLRSLGPARRGHSHRGPHLKIEARDRQEALACREIVIQGGLAAAERYDVARPFGSSSLGASFSSVHVGGA